MLRRTFVQQAALLASPLAAPFPILAQYPGPIVLMDSSGIDLSWAVRQLQDDAQTREINIRKGTASDDAASYIELATSAATPTEGFEFATGSTAGKPSIRVTASDRLGFTYGLLEIGDRLRYGAALSSVKAIKQQPANTVRSMTRAFVSDVEDKPWFNDKTFWRDYLTQLAVQRFNRFSLTLGLGYDFPRGVTGDYLHFPYPYLLKVPGFDVRAVPLDDAERDHNLEMLRFISDETAQRGLHFQLGIWTHAYEWTDSPHSHHHITGLTSDTHGPYCKAAIALLLKQCPNIDGLTMRVHGESGVPEGSYDFWQMVFDGIAGAGRRIEIDMHAKGLDQRMIDIGLKTGMPVKVSPKFWAEHMGLGYQQAAIRELEMPRPGEINDKYFSLSNGSRRFMRYGYGDLFQEGRKFDVLFRVWPGTQRLLLWGDPETAAGFGEAAHFAGASGVEICEPLFFKGRNGSGLPGGRCAYADESLNPPQDWMKYEYTYRVWGRLLYDPKADSDGWRRALRGQFETAAAPIEIALASASRVLPLITTAHLPSASNLGCWMENYTNMPIVAGDGQDGPKVPYADTVTPKRLGTVSPLDPQLFSSIAEHVGGGSSVKYSPVEVAQWLEDLALSAERQMALAVSAARQRTSPEFRRIEEDVYIQAGLGRFFAAQLRSAVLYEIYLYTKSGEALTKAVVKYREARDAWAKFAERAKSVYRADITFGDIPIRRGHWIDRLPAIDQDLVAMQAKLASAKELKGTSTGVNEALSRPGRIALRCEHRPPATFHSGKALHITLKAEAPAARLVYRHVDQAERWQTVAMHQNGQTFDATIPAEYTASAFHLQYYFEAGTIFPGFAKSLSSQPYFFVARVAV